MYKMFKQEIAQLQKIVELARKRLQAAPQGSLRIKGKKNGVEYYYKGEGVGNKNGKYIRKSEERLARAIAQRDYDLKLVKYATERIKLLQAFIEKEPDTSLKRLYEDTNNYRRRLIDAPVISDEEYVKRWQEVKYKGLGFDEEAPGIITDRGERVRSKSEKIIADKLNSLNIPYRYEYPLHLDKDITIHPDFTILKMPKRKEIYLEHLGMMDDSDYVEKTIRKIGTYERNGIYLGVNLFFTYETSKKPLNAKALETLAREVFYGW